MIYLLFLEGNNQMNNSGSKVSRKTKDLVLAALFAALTCLTSIEAM